MSALPNPSSRLQQAAEAERAELARHQTRLLEERRAAKTRLEEIEQTLAELDRRLAALAQLAPADGAEAATDDEPLANGSASAQLLSGPKIREVAIRVLMMQPEEIEAIHYRRWYDLLRSAGYEIAGKDPVAVFLTQLTRSPLVRKTTQRGIYEFDRSAVSRLRERLDGLHTELQSVSVSADDPADLAEIRARRQELSALITQHERALEEALRALAPEAGDEDRDRSTPPAAVRA